MKYKKFLENSTDRRTYHIIRCINQDPYLEECWSFHKAKGSKWNRKKWYKEVTQYEYRMYRTWKYNRNTQYKL